MKFSLRYILILFIIIGVLHFVANATGLYETRVVWFDNVLHILAGVGFGLFWLWICEKRDPQISFGFSFSSLIIFVLITAFVWELFEFLFLKLFTQYAHRLSIYSPSLGEASIDVISNLIGAFVLILIIRSKSKQNTAV